MNLDTEDTIKQIRDDLETVAANGTEIWARQERARQIRFNEWDGQSPDGRRHADAIDGEALPFEGAPDNRITLVDSAINEKVKVSKRAFFRAMLQAKPTQSANASRASAVSSLMTWLRDRVLRTELDTEVELSAQYMHADDPGIVVVETTWLRDLGLVRKSLTFEQLAVMFVTGVQNPDDAPPAPQQGDEEMMAEFADLAINPEREAEWLGWLGQMFPGATPKALRTASRELRKTGATDLPVPEIRENRPRVEVLKFFDDIFFPIGTVNIQRARSIDRREWLSEVELRERVHTLGWDADVVEEIIEKGKGQSLLSYPLRFRQWTGIDVFLSGPGRAVNERDNLFEVWWSLRREADELGIPGINCTVWSCVVKDAWLKRSVADYPDGEYPYVMRTRERVGRQTTDSRGMSVPISTHQGEMKVQRDARGAYVQMVASPPMKMKISRGAYELVLGPNSQIPVQKMDDFDLVTLPNFLQNSVEMENVSRKEAEEYFGLMRPDVDENRVGLFQQDDADNFVALWCEVFAKILSLAQSYYTEEDLDRATGQGDIPLHLTPEDIRGKWEVSIEIDARDLNMEFAMKKMDAYGKLLNYDSGGTLDRTPFVAWAAMAIDPILARQTVQPSGAVTQKMLEQERSNVTGMAMGVEPIMNPDGVSNPQFRMQAVMQTIAQSPRLAQLHATDPLFNSLVANYQKYLTQQAVQDQNKLVGKIGTMPTQSVPGLYAGGAQAPGAAA